MQPKLFVLKRFLSVLFTMVKRRTESKCITRGGIAK